jgi:hypothetical protein
MGEKARNAEYLIATWFRAASAGAMKEHKERKRKRLILNFFCESLMQNPLAARTSLALHP